MNRPAGHSAVKDRRAATLNRLRSVLSDRDRHGAFRCSTRLRRVLDSGRRVGDEPHTVMVAYGGGKDSSYTLAFVRTIQLMLFEAGHDGFRLRSVTNRHAGMPRAVMENIDRAYRALALPGDPACEMLLVDGDEVKPFDVALPTHPGVVRRNRTDILMTGHRTFADARPTFCNACNLSMVNAFGRAAAAGRGVDIIITGDSQQEQRDYRLWVTQLGRSHGLLPRRSELSGFKGFLKTVDNIAQAYFTDIHGADAAAVAERRVGTDVRPDLRFFSIYDDTAYSSGHHWELLTDLLGFVFDDLAFSFSESDCGNPALMAHLRGLKCERVYGRGYAEGLAEYVDFALGIMARKEFPEPLIKAMRARYQDPDAELRMRKIVEEYAIDAYGLDERHLVCMAYSPFLAQGAELARYLEREQPHLSGRLPEIHRVLAGSGPPQRGAVADVLEAISGLAIDQLRILYRSQPHHVADGGRPNLLGSILAGDPHKDVVRTRHSPDGPIVTELLSGR